MRFNRVSPLFTTGRVLGLLGLLVLATCLTGCSSVYMKGTPLYTGEFSQPQGPAEERVNLWPLAYYHDPALSVLWPMCDWTDDHVALRPLYSMYKLDKEKHQYNVLWPISQFDFDKSHYHVLPFFWGGQPNSKYMGMFPLIWYWPGEQFTVFPVAWYDVGRSFTLFPVLWADPGDHYVVFPLSWYFVGESYTLFPILWVNPGDHYVVFPIFWHYPEKFTGLFPLYTWDKRHNGYNANFLWPLIQAKNNDEGRGWRAGPLCGDYSWGDNNRYRFLLWPLAHECTDGDEKLRVVFPLYFGERGGYDDWDLVLPFFFRSDDHFLSLPYSRTQVAGGGHDHWFLGPLTGFRTGGLHRSHVFPLYLRDEESDMLLTPLVSYRKGEDEHFVNVAGPLFHYTWKGDDYREWHAPWPFVGAKRTSTQNGFHVWPLIWRERWESGRVKGGAMWPLIWFDKSPDESESKVLFLYSTSKQVWKTTNDETGETREHRNRHTWILPTYWYERDEWNPPYSYRGLKQNTDEESGEALRLQVSTGFWPLWHYKKTDKVETAKSDFSVLGWLYDSKRIVDTPEEGKASTYLRRRFLWRGMHYERQDERTSLDVFPFITHDREKDTGFRKTSFAWRLFRYERGRDGSVKTDILFIPVWRGKGAAIAD